jgi:hypothetical protein
MTVIVMIISTSQDCGEDNGEDNGDSISYHIERSIICIFSAPIGGGGV